MAYTFGEGSALSPKMSFDIDAQIYKGLNMAAQQERAKLAALSKKMSDAKLIDITGSNIHPLLRQDAQQNLTEGTAAMFTAAKSGQDPRGIGYQYQQRAENLTTDSEKLYNYEKASPKEYLVDPRIQQALRSGDKEALNQALQSQPERIRGFLHPLSNPTPLPLRDLKAELTKDYAFESNIDKYVPGVVKDFNGKDIQVAMLNPDVQNQAAVRYASDPVVQLNIMANPKYRGSYEKLYKEGIDQKMSEDEANSYALIGVVKSEMPTHSVTNNSTNIYMPGAETSKPSSYDHGVVNFMRARGNSPAGPVPFSLGFTTNVPLGTGTTISKAGMIRTFGEYDPNAIGFTEGKSGLITQLPIAQKNISVYEKGKLVYKIQAGDAIDDEQLDLIKKTNTDPSAVKYQPSAVYQYEVTQPDPVNPSRSTQVKKYAVKTIQPGAMGEMFSQQDVNKGVANQYFQVHKNEADRLTKDYETAIKQRLEQEKQAKATNKTAEVKTTQGQKQTQKTGGDVIPKGTILKGNNTFKKKTEDVTSTTPTTKQVDVAPATSQVAGKGGVDSSGYNTKLTSIANKLGVKPDDIRQIFHHESGTNPQSGIKKSKGPVGLLQFTEKTLRDEFKLTRQQVLDMSAEEQLGLVDRYLSKYRGKIKNIYDLSLVTLYPLAIDKPDDFVIGSEVSPAEAAKIGKQNYGINNGKPFTKAQYKAWVKKNIKPGLNVTDASSKGKGGLLASSMILNNNK